MENLFVTIALEKKSENTKIKKKNLFFSLHLRLG